MTRSSMTALKSLQSIVLRLHLLEKWMLEQKTAHV